METRIAPFIGLLLLTACAAPVQEEERIGFISNYSGLEKTDDQTYKFLSDRLAGYDTFMIDPIELLFERPDDPEFSDKQLENLKQYVAKELAEALTKGEDGYDVVSEPGPGVARLRLGITQLDKTIGALNLSTYTKITGAGLGGVAVEGEAVDSITGEQLAATVRWSSGSRIGRAGYTSTGDAKILIARWAKSLRADFDKLREAIPDV